MQFSGQCSLLFLLVAHEPPIRIVQKQQNIDEKEALTSGKTMWNISGVTTTLLHEPN